MKIGFFEEHAHSKNAREAGFAKGLKTEKLKTNVCKKCKEPCADEICMCCKMLGSLRGHR